MDRPETRELEGFVAVAEELNFARAAQRLHLSQPPLSRLIQKLEAKLGVKLLTRNTRRVQLTPAGTAFLEDARFLLRHLDRATDTVQRAAGGDFQVLNVGFVGAMLETEMIEVLRGFRRRNKNWQVRLHDMSGPDLIAALESRLVDGAFIGARPPSLPRGLRMVPWKKEVLTVALPAAHPLAKAGPVDLKKLAEENWALIERNSAPVFHRNFLHLCGEAGFRPRIILESPRMPALLAMVAAGEAICLLNGTTARPMPHVVFRPLGPKVVAVEHSFAFRNGEESSALAEFVRTLENR